MNLDFTSQTQWRERNPKAHWAHTAFRNALRRGLVERGPCEVCGSDEVDAHHPDYDRPMLVQWLCRKHHKAEHKRLKELADAAPEDGEARQ